MTYPEWLLEQITAIRIERRRAQWRRYSASEKGKERQGRYDNTIAGQMSKVTRDLRWRSGGRLAQLAQYESLLAS